MNTFQFPLTLFEPFVSKKKEKKSEIERTRPVKIEDMILDFNTWLTVITVTSL